MARVPLQQTPEVGLEIGSAPQFTGGRIEPVQDTVTDDIQRFSKAQRNVADIAIKLQEEYNDAEALKLSNDFEADVDEEKNKYLMTQGVNAVATVDNDTGATVYDTAIDNINLKLAEYGEKASNSQIKYLFENMAAVKIKNATSSMTKHSITQQRNYLEAETTAAISNHKKATIQNYQTWQDDEGAFKMNYIAGLQRINEKALQKGWNINPESGPISSQYIKEVNEYNMEIFKGVIKNFETDKNFKESDAFREALKQTINNPTEVAKIKVLTDKKHNNHLAEKLVNNVISNNTNQNNGQFLNQVNKLMTLDSNNNIDNNNGGSVDDGFNSNDELIDTTNNTISEKIELLEKIKNQSKFYDPETTTRLIPQHQTTHLFAIQKLGVKKADSLYTKAKSQIDIDTKKYKEDVTYAKKINGQIIDNYNKLIVEEAYKIYGRFGEGEYAITVANDLEVIKKGIDYDFTEETLNIDFVTGLRPLEDLKQELKDTIQDPTKLKYAIEDLEIKYNKIKTERETIYNEAFVNAKEIAFAEEGGWKNLEANGIDINNFKEEDQQILKNGHPQESDVDTVAELIDNPKEIRDNLNSYSHLLSQGQYQELVNYQAELRGEDKYIEAVGNKDLMKEIMYKNGFDWVYKSKFGGNAADFNSIHTEWVNRIDYAQSIQKNKLTRQEKVQILNNVLMDKVNLQGTLGFGKKTDKLTSTVMPDRLDDLFVKVKVKQEDGSFITQQIFTSEIPKEVSVAIMGNLYRRKLPMNQQNIAEEWVKFGMPKTLQEAEEFINANLNYQLAPSNIK